MGAREGLTALAATQTFDVVRLWPELASFRLFHCTATLNALLHVTCIKHNVHRHESVAPGSVHAPLSTTNTAPSPSSLQPPKQILRPNLSTTEHSTRTIAHLRLGLELRWASSSVGRPTKLTQFSGFSTAREEYSGAAVRTSPRTRTSQPIHYCEMA